MVYTGATFSKYSVSICTKICFFFLILNVYRERTDILTWRYAPNRNMSFHYTEQKMRVCLYGYLFSSSGTGMKWTRRILLTAEKFPFVKQRVSFVLYIETTSLCKCNSYLFHFHNCVCVDTLFIVYIIPLF